jgi:hypothetical protein
MRYHYIVGHENAINTYTVQSFVNFNISISSAFTVRVKIVNSCASSREVYFQNNSTISSSVEILSAESSVF